jgi:hypothetical protein
VPSHARIIAKEINKDGRFIAYDNGTVLDTKTNLMWAAKDNGSHINWEDAKSYCNNYRGGGYADWRMPWQSELAGLYDAAKAYRVSLIKIHITKLIRLSTLTVWAADTRGSGHSSEVALFYFADDGSRDWRCKSDDLGAGALPVRYGK